MNTRMWQHPATQANVATLRARGVEIVGPVEGELAEGRRASGGWPSRRRSVRGIEVLLERGERGRSEASACWSRPAAHASRSTRCGSSATARPAAWASRSPRRRDRRGADVTLLAANLAVPRPPGVTVVETPRLPTSSARPLRAADADVDRHGRRGGGLSPRLAVRREARQGRRGLGGRARADR